MKKVILLCFLFVAGIVGQASAVSYTGFLSQLEVPSVRELTITGNPSHNASLVTLSVMNNVAGSISTIDFSVLCNYDGWHVVAYSSSQNGLINTSKTHTIPLLIEAVSFNATAPLASAYITLNYSTSEPTSANVANTLISGNYIGNTGDTPSKFTMYIKADPVEFAKRRGGFYSVYINLMMPVE